jgi:hypothetical protein
MRIGELLVEQRKLRQSELARALADKPADKRMCSFLIARGLVEFDDASRALGEQRGVPCALAKHLAGRDPALAELIPAELGRGSCALPIGRTSKGALIVCVRDPAPALLAALRRAVPGEVIMVVAPATRLEHLVASAYGVAPVDELDIDFSLEGEPPLPDMDTLDPESVRLALTDLDDVRVAKDPTQSGQVPVVPPTRPSQRAITADPRATRPMSVGMMSVGLEHAMSREAATDLVLAFVATRWRSAIVLAIRDRSAMGYRGHGVTMPELVAIPLTVPSTLQRAVESRMVSAETPASAAQDVLVRALESPRTIAAAPVLVGGQPVAVIVAGDPIDTGTDEVAELGSLAEALGSAYQRIAAR